MIRTSCSGLLYDRQRLDNWIMNNERGFGCYAMYFKRSSIAIQNDIILTDLASPNKETISMNSFSSTKFTKLYQSLYLPPSIILSQLDIKTQEYFNIVETIKKRDCLYQQKHRSFSNMIVQT